MTDSEILSVLLPDPERTLRAIRASMDFREIADV
jgi:hypothetical protein